MTPTPQLPHPGAEQSHHATTTLTPPLASLPTPSSSYPLGARSTHRLPTVTASQLLAATPSTTHIPLLPRLDPLLSHPGGLPPGQVTELFGPPGIGKTAFALTLAASALRLNKRVVWLDCGYPLYLPRLHNLLPDDDDHTRDDMLARFTVVRCATLPQLIATVLSFPNRVVGEDADLLVLDALSTLFVAAYPPGMEDLGAVEKQIAARRFGVGQELVSGLAKVARGGRGVVVTQGCTTKVVAGMGAVLKPAIGWDGWVKGVNVRLALWRGEGGCRVVEVLKSKGRNWEELREVEEVRFNIVKGRVKEEEVPVPVPVLKWGEVETERPEGMPREQRQNVERAGQYEEQEQQAAGFESVARIEAQEDGTLQQDAEVQQGGMVQQDETEYTGATDQAEVQKPVEASPPKRVLLPVTPVTGKRKRGGIEVGYIPDSEESSDEEAGDEFGWGDDDAGIIGEKGITREEILSDQVS